MRIAIAGTGGLALLIAQSIVQQTAHPVVMLSRTVRVPLIRPSFIRDHSGEIVAAAKSDRTLDQLVDAIRRTMSSTSASANVNAEPTSRSRIPDSCR